MQSTREESERSSAEFSGGKFVTPPLHERENNEGFVGAPTTARMDCCLDSGDAEVAPTNIPAVAELKERVLSRIGSRSRQALEIINPWI